MSLRYLHHLSLAAVIATEAIAGATLLTPMPAAGQFFDDRVPFQSRRQRGFFDWFEPAQQQQERQAPAPLPDYSKAPASKKADPKAEAAVTTPIMVLGDGMADWLGYGIELAYADSPEIGILRRHRTSSGLIRIEVRNDARGEYPDWPQAAREMIAAQKPKFVLMMIGVNDRRQIRETAQVAPAARGAKPPPAASQPIDAAALELDRPEEKVPDRAASTPAEPAASGGNRTLEFRTDAWSEAYIRRIDDTIAALKTSGVPVFWVGLPPLRGQKSATDIPFLNDLYRSRADKAGIVYIDIWDGFVDEDGRYAQSGPDVEGQTRRLRAGDGVYFTQAGARKLAHYAEREIQRWLSTRGGPVAVAIPQEPKAEVPSEGSRSGVGAGTKTRPLAGPAVPLIAERGAESEELLGGNDRQQAVDALATKVLVRGEAVTPPAGRADDFMWPRRGVAPVGTDPAVAVAELPMTPMVADRMGSSPTAAPSTDVAVAPKPVAVRRTPRPAYADAQSYYRRPPQIFQPFGFQSLFGGRW
jgi:uncharacterized protein